MKKQTLDFQPPERPRSALLHASISTAKAMIERIDTEALPALEAEADTLAAAVSFDADRLTELQSRKSALLVEREMVNRRMTLLAQQREESLKEESVQRMLEIAATLTAQGEETETLYQQWNAALLALITATQGFLPIAQERSSLLNEAEFLRLAYNLSTLPYIDPLGLPAGSELKGLVDTLAQLRGPFPDRFAQEKLAIREQRRQATPLPAPPPVEMVRANLIERDSTPATTPQKYPLSGYEVGLVSVQGAPRRPSMAERKAKEFES